MTLKNLGKIYISQILIFAINGIIIINTIIDILSYIDIQNKIVKKLTEKIWNNFFWY